MAEREGDRAGGGGGMAATGFGAAAKLDGRIFMALRGSPCRPGESDTGIMGERLWYWEK